MKKRVTNSGFTLIELSIVLIIIGLLVGGILVGQDLIESARVRSQVNQINSYDTALNTFQLKYDAVPGDCDNCGSAGFNLRAALGSGAALDATIGDGDGLIEGDITGTFATGAGFEAAHVYVDLSGAGLVDGIYLQGELPESKLETGAIALVGGSAGRNYFVIGAISGSDTICATGNCMTPVAAWTLDTKMDDGITNTGTVTVAPVGANITTGATWEGAAGNANCPATGAYDISDETNGDCPLKIRTSL